MFVYIRVCLIDKVLHGMMDVNWNVNVNKLNMDTTDVIRGIK